MPCNPSHTQREFVIMFTLEPPSTSVSMTLCPTTLMLIMGICASIEVAWQNFIYAFAWVFFTQGISAW